VEYLHYLFYFDPGNLVFLVRFTWYCVMCVGESFFSFFNNDMISVVFLISSTSSHVIDEHLTIMQF